MAAAAHADRSSTANDSNIGRPGPPTAGLNVTRLSDQVQALLRDMILSGALPAGRATQDELASMLGVSVTPVREALLRLEGEGFVARARNRHVVILGMTADDLADLYEAHAHISAMLARRACARASLQVRTRLHEVLSQWDEVDLQAVNSRRALESANWEFHRIVNLAADSPKLLRILNISLRYIPRGFYSLLGDWALESRTGHQALVEAFDATDPEKAARAASEHVLEAGRRLVTHFEAGHLLQPEIARLRKDSLERDA